MTDQELIRALHKIHAIKFEDVVLEIGVTTPVYIDLRILISHPLILKEVAKAYAGILEQLAYDRLVAIPYAAMPLAGAISLTNGKPWIYTRKEAKGYGIEKPAEGEYREGETGVLIDDTITNGLSKVRAARTLEKIGLRIQDIVILVDREQGGREELEKRGYKLHSVFTITQILTQLLQEKSITRERYDKVVTFLKETPLTLEE